MPILSEVILTALKIIIIIAADMGQVPHRLFPLTEEEQVEEEEVGDGDAI